MMKAVIFDVDGVLLDSFESNFVFIQELLAAFGYPEVTREQYAQYFHKTFSEAMAGLAGVKDEHELENMKEYVVSNTLRNTEPPVLAEEAEKTIATLREAYSLGIVTGRAKAFVSGPPLDAVLPYFEVIIAQEDTEHHKPHPEPLLLAAERLGANPSEAVYIGDARSDLEAAHAAGMRFIHYCAAGDVPEAEAKTDDFSELPALISSFSIS